MKWTLFLAVSLVLFSSIVFSETAININEGWNLVPAGNDITLEQQCPYITEQYSLSPAHNGAYLKKARDASGKWVQEGPPRTSYIRAGLALSYVSAMADYAKYSQEGYVVPDSVGAGKWVKAGRQCSFTVASIRPGRPDTMLFKGWNFVAIDDYKNGKNLREAFGQCTNFIARAYTYDGTNQEWVNEMDYPSDSLDDKIKSKTAEAGKVYLLQVANECRLASGATAPPPGIPATEYVKGDLLGKQKVRANDSLGTKFNKTDFADLTKVVAVDIDNGVKRIALERKSEGGGIGTSGISNISEGAEFVIPKTGSGKYILKVASITKIGSTDQYEAEIELYSANEVRPQGTTPGTNNLVRKTTAPTPIIKTIPEQIIDLESTEQIVTLFSLPEYINNEKQEKLSFTVGQSDDMFLRCYLENSLVKCRRMQMTAIGTFPILVNAIGEDNKLMGQRTFNVTIRARGTNRAPTIKAIPDQQIPLSSLDGTVVLDLTPYIEDPDDAKDKLFFEHSQIDEEVVMCEAAQYDYKLKCYKPKKLGEGGIRLSVRDPTGNYAKDAAGYKMIAVIKVKVVEGTQPNQPAQGENFAPTILPIPDIELKVGTEGKIHLDFWNYVYDYRPVSDEKGTLIYSLSGDTAIIPCYLVDSSGQLSTTAGRYLKCGTAASTGPSNLNLTVIDRGGMGATRNFKVNVVYIPQAPEITSVTPSTGKPLESIMITGKNFAQFNNKVIIGGVEITGVQSFSNGTLLNIQLPNTVGEFDLKVSNGNAESRLVKVKIEAQQTAATTTPKTRFYKGETIEGIAGDGKYNGQSLSGTVTDIYIDPQTYYHAYVRLFDGGLNFIDYRGVVETTDFRNTFTYKDLDEPFEAVLKSNIKVSKIGTDESGKLYMDITRG
ncbi:MAG: IPT/TIG domain-containing protein [Candidatus Diapherotrites archaeon]|uniref:IPT/TIG domain-containing protein n=1 Tax=Candidatus Iainarchaeum sp. TaxID=3101447 RepID=A0A8T3YMJ4_9ARCH|nr:IPT/TIG domain-containing protein [Candidatus Diapherotrites archaeon]